MKKVIDVGQLNERINIKRQHYQTDTTGSPVEKSVPILTQAWAKVDDVSGLEDEDNGRVVSVAITKFTVRYNAELLQDYKNLIICYNDNEYNVHYIKQLGRKTYIELKAIIRE